MTKTVEAAEEVEMETSQRMDVRMQATPDVMDSILGPDAYAGLPGAPRPSTPLSGASLQADVLRAFDSYNTELSNAAAAG